MSCSHTCHPYLAPASPLENRRRECGRWANYYQYLFLLACECLRQFLSLSRRQFLHLPAWVADLALAGQLWIAALMGLLSEGVPIVAITLPDLLSVVTVVVVQPIHSIGGCPYPAHQFIDVLAKVSYVKNATSVVQARKNQVFPEAFEHGWCKLSCICVHDTHLTANNKWSIKLLL